MTETLADTRRWRVDRADCLDWLAGLPEDCADLVVTSPPYEDARLYLESGRDLGIARQAEEWVAWMAGVVRACLRVCKGLVAVVCEGKQSGWSYSATPFLLLADLVRSGVVARKPAVYHRVGIPGSGHDGWRNDWEPVLLFTRLAGRLPWSNPTACGHPPKSAPGGDCTSRLASGQRANSQQRANVGSHLAARQAGKKYRPPALANPGNVIDCGAVGGGNMGARIAHENEAPYPEQLARPLVLTFCPPGGLVLDPFAGSGTTLAVAVASGRRALGCDLRQSQVDLATRRLLQVTPPLPGMEP